MYLQHPDLHTAIVSGQKQDYLREAQMDRRLREAGILPRGWLSCQVCHSLFMLGGALVRMGRRLETRFAPPAWYGPDRRQLAG